MAVALALSMILVAVFLGLAHLGVRVPDGDFQAVTAALAVFGGLLALAAPAVGLVLVVAVAAARRIVLRRIPDRLPAWVSAA